MLDGVDVSAYQAGIDPAVVSGDFFIVKATEGLSYVSEDYRRCADAVLASGKLLGLYHYASGLDPIAEATRYATIAEPYIGKAVLFLDWESGGNRSFTGGSADADWVRKFRDHIHLITGNECLVYASESVAFNLGVSSDRLWVAQYANYDRTGYQDHPWNEGAYECLIRQYSSSGALSGWNGNLDLNKFYGSREDWLTLTGGEVMTDQDYDKIAERVWNFIQNGVRCRDRLQGTDEAVNECRYQLTRTDDPTGRGMTNNIYDHVKYIAAKISGIDSRLEEIEKKIS